MLLGNYCVDLKLRPWCSHNKSMTWRIDIIFHLFSLVTNMDMKRQISMCLLMFIMIFKLIQIESDIDINNDELFETHMETFKTNWLPLVVCNHAKTKWYRLIKVLLVCKYNWLIYRHGCELLTWDVLVLQIQACLQGGDWWNFTIQEGGLWTLQHSWSCMFQGLNFSILPLKHTCEMISCYLKKFH